MQREVSKNRHSEYFPSCPIHDLASRCPSIFHPFSAEQAFSKSIHINLGSFQFINFLLLKWVLRQPQYIHAVFHCAEIDGIEVRNTSSKLTVIVTCKGGVYEYFVVLFILFGSCEKFKNCRISCYQHISHAHTHECLCRRVCVYVCLLVKWLGTELVFWVLDTLLLATVSLVWRVFTNLKICLCLLALAPANPWHGGRHGLARDGVVAFNANCHNSACARDF